MLRVTSSSVTIALAVVLRPKTYVLLFVAMVSALECRDVTSAILSVLPVARARVLYYPVGTAAAGVRVALIPASLVAVMAAERVRSSVMTTIL